MAKAYIQELQNRDGDSIYPVTTADGVYLQKSDASGVITQQTLSSKLESMETSFQDGVNTIVAALTELGVTPESTTPAGIAAAIKTLYSDQYAAGVKKGHADVIADPGSYGLITQTQYENYGKTCYTNGYNAGVTAADNRVNTSSASYKSGYSAGVSAGIAGLNKSVTASCTYSGEADDGSRIKLDGGGSATATIQNGVLTVSVSANCTGKADHYSNGEWVHRVTLTKNASGNNKVSAA